MKVSIYLTVFFVSIVSTTAMSCPPIAGVNTYPCPAQIGDFSPLLSAAGDSLITSPELLVTQTGSLTLPDGTTFTGSANYHPNPGVLQIREGVLNGVKLISGEYTSSVLTRATILESEIPITLENLYKLEKTSEGFSGVTGLGFSVKAPHLIKAKKEISFEATEDLIIFKNEFGISDIYVSFPNLELIAKKMLPSGNININLAEIIKIESTDLLAKFRNYPNREILIKTVSENSTDLSSGAAEINSGETSITCDTCELEINCSEKIVYRSYNKSKITLTPEGCNIEGTGHIIVISDNFEISGTLLENGKFNYKTEPGKQTHLVEGVNTVLKMIPDSESIFEGPDAVYKYFEKAAEKTLTKKLRNQPFIAIGFENAPIENGGSASTMNILPVNDVLSPENKIRLSNQKEILDLTPKEAFAKNNNKGFSSPNKLHFAWKNQDLRVGINPKDATDAILKGKSRALAESVETKYRLTGNNFDSFIKFKPLEGTISLTTRIDVGKNGNLGFELNERAVTLSGSNEFKKFTGGIFAEVYPKGREIDIMSGGFNSKTEAKGLIAVWGRW